MCISILAGMSLERLVDVIKDKLPSFLSDFAGIRVRKTGDNGNAMLPKKKARISKMPAIRFLYRSL